MRHALHTALESETHPAPGKDTAILFPSNPYPGSPAVHPVTAAAARTTTRAPAPPSAAPLPKSPSRAALTKAQSPASRSHAARPPPLRHGRRNKYSARPTNAETTPDP